MECEINKKIFSLINQIEPRPKYTYDQMASLICHKPYFPNNK